MTLVIEDAYNAAVLRYRGDTWLRGLPCFTENNALRRAHAVYSGIFCMRKPNSGLCFANEPRHALMLDPYHIVPLVELIRANRRVQGTYHKLVVTGINLAPYLTLFCRPAQLVVRVHHIPPHQSEWFIFPFKYGAWCALTLSFSDLHFLKGLKRNAIYFVGNANGEHTAHFKYST